MPEKRPPSHAGPRSLRPSTPHPAGLPSGCPPSLRPGTTHESRPGPNHPTQSVADDAQRRQRTPPDANRQHEISGSWNPLDPWRTQRRRRTPIPLMATGTKPDTSPMGPRGHANSPGYTYRLEKLQRRRGGLRARTGLPDPRPSGSPGLPPTYGCRRRRPGFRQGA